MITTAAGDPGQDNIRRYVRVGPLGGGRGGFIAEARVHARQGQQGAITRYSNSHGLCYEVRHDDGTFA